MKQVNCGRCGALTSEPSLSLCGHLFCTPCITTFFTTSSKKCPLCNKMNPPRSSKLIESVPFHQGMYCMLEAPKGNSEDYYERAISLFKAAITENPAISYAECNIGCCYANLGNADAAIEYFKLALCKDANDTKALYTLGIVLSAMGLPQCAEEYLTRAVGVPDTPADLQADYQQALNDAQEAISKLYLRFAVGDRVLCRTDAGGLWEEGQVIKLHYREGSFEPDECWPYHVLLVNKCKCNQAECSCGGREAVCVPRDEDTCVRAVRPHPLADKALNRTTKERISGTVFSSQLLRKEVLRSVRPADKKWLAPIFDYFFSAYTTSIRPRQRVHLIDDPNLTLTKMVQDMVSLIPTDSDEILRKRISEGDSNAMLQLADTHMLHIRRSPAERDVNLACELYYDAAEAGNLEALVQVAMLNYAQLNPAEGGKYNFGAPVRRPRTDRDRQLLETMWKNLEEVASMDYICSFLLVQAEHALRDGTWVLSNTVRNILARNADAVAAREAPAISKTRFSERISAESGVQIGEVKCFNPVCPNKDMVGVKFSTCSKCGTAKYCGRDCQAVDWKVHKKECADMKAGKAQAVAAPEE